MAKMRVVQVGKAGGALELVERDIPQPETGQVRIKVQACGVCHSDSITKEGYFPNINYPRVPGHEVAGVIDAIGPNVSAEHWKVGQRVGVGWYGGHCGNCKSCFNSLRNSGARAGDLVAVLGIGGLGHLAVQFAAKMGFRTVAIARGKDKEALAKKLGAAVYIDSSDSDVAAELQKLGGADVIVATVTNAEAMSKAMGGLGVGASFVILGAAAEPMSLNGLDIIMNRQSVKGWPSGVAADSEDTLAFSVLANVRSMNEEYPLEKAAEAYDRMISGKAKFRVVLTTGH
ncbi:alcohol dehydrogenase [soil metagenome]